MISSSSPQKTIPSCPAESSLFSSRMMRWSTSCSLANCSGISVCLAQPSPFIFYSKSHYYLLKNNHYFYFYNFHCDKYGMIVIFMQPVTELHTYNQHFIKIYIPTYFSLLMKVLINYIKTIIIGYSTMLTIQCSNHLPSLKLDPKLIHCTLLKPMRNVLSRFRGKFNFTSTFNSISPF